MKSGLNSPFKVRLFSKKPLIQGQPPHLWNIDRETRIENLDSASQKDINVSSRSVPTFGEVDVEFSSPDCYTFIVPVNAPTRDPREVLDFTVEGMPGVEVLEYAHTDGNKISIGFETHCEEADVAHRRFIEWMEGIKSRLDIIRAKFDSYNESLREAAKDAVNKRRVELEKTAEIKKKLLAQA